MKQELINIFTAGGILFLSALFARSEMTVQDRNPFLLLSETLTSIPSYFSEAYGDIKEPEENRNDVPELSVSENNIGAADSSAINSDKPSTSLSDNILTETNSPTFTTAPEDYFQDALFIGDSRTVGLSEYGGIEGADFFATTGLNVYKIKKEKIDIDGLGSTTLFELLAKKTYGKIYVMFGINELGYNYEISLEKYTQLITDIRAFQPDAVVFIEANLHVSKIMSDSDEIHNNENINRFNNAISLLADGKDIFYIDVNEIFDDEEGNLAQNYTYDNSHLLGKYYELWTQWLRTHAVVR